MFKDVPPPIRSRPPDLRPWAPSWADRLAPAPPSHTCRPVRGSQRATLFRLNMRPPPLNTAWPAGQKQTRRGHLIGGYCKKINARMPKTTTPATTPYVTRSAMLITCGGAMIFVMSITLSKKRCGGTRPAAAQCRSSRAQLNKEVLRQHLGHIVIINTSASGGRALPPGRVLRGPAGFTRHIYEPLASSAGRFPSRSLVRRSSCAC